MPNEHTLSVRVRNEFGVLSRVAGLFSGRGYNIDSLCVAETLDPKVSQITLVTSADDEQCEQIVKHGAVGDVGYLGGEAQLLLQGRADGRCSDAPAPGAEQACQRQDRGDARGATE